MAPERPENMLPTYKDISDAYSSMFRFIGDLIGSAYTIAAAAWLEVWRFLIDAIRSILLAAKRAVIALYNGIKVLLTALKHTVVWLQKAIKNTISIILRLSVLATFIISPALVAYDPLDWKVVLGKAVSETLSEIVYYVLILLTGLADYFLIRLMLQRKGRNADSVDEKPNLLERTAEAATSIAAWLIIIGVLGYGLMYRIDVAKAIFLTALNGPKVASPKDGSDVVMNSINSECKAAQVFRSDQIKWKDIWTTSKYSYAPSGARTDGGGLADGELRVGGWGDWYFTLIQFDVTALPAHASRVYLMLYSIDVEGTRVSMFLDQITENWDFKQGERLWWKDLPDGRTVDSLRPPRRESWYSIDVTNLYIKWKNGVQKNYGIELRPADNQNHFNRFVSSRGVDESDIPRLVICG